MEPRITTNSGPLLRLVRTRSAASMRTQDQEQQ